MRLPRKHEIPLVILTYQMTCCSGFFATRENIRPLKPRQDEKPHRMFCQKEVYRDSKRYWYPPLGFAVPSIASFRSTVPSVASFRSMYRELAENPRYTFAWQLWKATWNTTSYFSQKEVYRDRIGIPLLVLLCLQYALNSWFFVQCTVNWQNIPVYRCLAFFN